MKKKKPKRKTDYSRSYRYWLVGFGLTLLLIFLTPALLGREYDFKAAELGEYLPLGSTAGVALVERGYAPEDRYLELAFYVREGALSGTGVSNLDYTAEAKYITGKQALDVTVVRVNDNYFVVEVRNLPPGFSVLSLTILPEYLYPELESSDTVTGKKVKLYVNETAELVDPELESGSLEDYQRAYLDVEIRFLAAEIVEKETAILDARVAISQAKEMIQKLQSDMEFQTKEEKSRTESAISRYESAINSYEQSITDALEEITVLEEKISFQEARKAAA